MRNQNVALLVDINNFLYGAFKRYERRVDYKKFLEAVAELGNIRTAIAFGSGSSDDCEAFKSLLRHLGYECRWAQGKYNWNVGITVEAVRQREKSDLIVIGSGDPFLAPCAEWIRQQGIKCYAYGFRISDAMRGAVDRHYEVPEVLLIADANATNA